MVNVDRYSIHGAYGMKLFKDQILKAVDIMIWFKQPISHSKSTLLMIHQVVAARFCVSMAMFFLYGSMTDLAQLEDDQSYWPQQKPMDFLFKFMEHGTLKWCFFVGIFQVSGAKIWNTLDTKSLFPRLFVWLHWLDVEKQIYPPYPFLLVAYNIVASVIYWRFSPTRAGVSLRQFRIRNDMLEDLYTPKMSLLKRISSDIFT